MTSKYRFQILCKECDQLMRYDKEHYLDYGIMKWLCWDCEQEVATTDLLDTVIP